MRLSWKAKVMILLCVFDIRASNTLCFTRVELLKHCVLWGFSFATCHFTMCFWDWSFQNTVFCEGRVSETLCFARVNFRDPPFSLSFWEVDVTNACYLHENRWGHNLGHTWWSIHWSEREAARNPQCKHCLGNKSRRAITRSFYYQISFHRGGPLNYYFREEI